MRNILSLIELFLYEALSCVWKLLIIMVRDIQFYLTLNMDHWVLLHASKILDGIKQCCFERIEQLCKMSKVKQSIKRAIVIMSFMEKLTIFLYNSERFIIKIPWQKISWTERGKGVVDVVISSCAVLICFLQQWQHAILILFFGKQYISYSLINGIQINVIYGHLFWCHVLGLIFWFLLILL